MHIFKHTRKKKKEFTNSKKSRSSQRENREHAANARQSIKLYCWASDSSVPYSFQWNHCIGAVGLLIESLTGNADCSRT